MVVAVTSACRPGVRTTGSYTYGDRVGHIASDARPCGALALSRVVPIPFPAMLESGAACTSVRSAGGMGCGPQPDESATPTWSKPTWSEWV